MSGEFQPFYSSERHLIPELNLRLTVFVVTLISFFIKKFSMLELAAMITYVIPCRILTSVSLDTDPLGSQSILVKFISE